MMETGRSALRHNWHQPCTKGATCDCRECCLCRVCLFDRRSASIYRGLKSRLAAKKWKSGARAGEIRREKRDLPFSLDQFRAWLRVVLEDQPFCEYCEKPISIQTISPDHRKPMSRGGSLALSNLAVCDRDCNSLKGELLPGEFKALMKGLASFTEDGRKDVLSRLRGSSVHIHQKNPGAVEIHQAAPSQDSRSGVLAFPPNATQRKKRDDAGAEDF